jgi:integrase
VEDSIGHLRATFALARAVEITPDRVSAYMTARLADGAANATINRELAALKRMFRLGRKAGKVADVPIIDMLAEHNTRKGFFERDQFNAVLAELPDYWRPAFETAYITGWRCRSEILSREWKHVDFAGGWLRLEPGETKNGEGRQFPLTPELRAVLEAQRERTDAAEQETGRILPWVFWHGDGERLRDYRRAWSSACRKAGLPGRHVHDFRRTAVRALERSGVPRSAAMAMVGHKTESIYRRYAIVDEAMLREAGEKLSAHHQAERERPASFATFRKTAQK